MESEPGISALRDQTGSSESRCPETGREATCHFPAASSKGYRCPTASVRFVHRVKNLRCTWLRWEPAYERSMFRHSRDAAPSQPARKSCYYPCTALEEPPGR